MSELPLSNPSAGLESYRPSSEARGEPVPAGEPPRIREVTVTWPHEPAASFPQSQRGHSPPGARGLCRIANLR